MPGAQHGGILTELPGVNPTVSAPWLGQNSLLMRLRSCACTAVGPCSCCPPCLVLGLAWVPTMLHAHASMFALTLEFLFVMCSPVYAHAGWCLRGLLWALSQQRP